MRSNRFTFAMVSLAALFGIKSKEVKPQTQHRQTIKKSKRKNVQILDDRKKQIELRTITW